jgi:RimJ/RimL family protein N-acetyltransferase
MKPLKTKRLVVRQFTRQDAGFILDILNQPSFLSQIGDRGVRTLQDAENYLQKGPMESYTRHGFSLFLVELKGNQTAIGMCGLIKRETLQDVEIGFAFLPQYWSHGYALEAASAVLAYGLEELKSERITAIVLPGNERSIHLLEKLGLKYERMITWQEDGAELKLFSTGGQN